METPLFKIHVNDSNYSSWNIYEMTHYTKVDLPPSLVHPINNKLFMNDVFRINDIKEVELVHSTVRHDLHIAGVLILVGNKTYGSQHELIAGKSYTHHRAMQAKGKLLYKCVPDDARLPAFLVPYKIDRHEFSKVLSNVYVTIMFDNWEGKHPKAVLHNVIGPVDNLINFYEYQLFCKSLNVSIHQFVTATNKALKDTTHDAVIDTIIAKYPDMEDRTHWHVLTIDPLNSLDFDDGFSIRPLSNGITQLSIYISNVTVWLDVLNLWDSFSRRISTIYLPDKKRPMLPSVLSDRLCSLQEHVRRIAFTMDIFIKDGLIVDMSWCNSVINVAHNYVYDAPQLRSSKPYNHLLICAQELALTYKYIQHVNDSHDLVSYLMILMNSQCATQLLQQHTGIFRSTAISVESEVSNPDLPPDVAKFVKIWNSSAGQYMDGSKVDGLNESTSLRHDMLNLDAYIHITSPIRRLVDLLNIIQFQKSFSSLSENADIFYNKWLSELDYINASMRSVRKVQCDCALIHLCTSDSAILEKEYTGYLFDRLTSNNGAFKYVVYLPELNMSSRITVRDEFANYTQKQFKLFVFEDEHKFNKKIRLHLVG